VSSGPDAAGTCSILVPCWYILLVYSGGASLMVQATKQPLGMVTLAGCRCRCGHEWFPRSDERPRVCPNCKSPNWDRPKKFEKDKRPAKKR
jgi:hypothetical protein